MLPFYPDKDIINSHGNNVWKMYHNCYHITAVAGRRRRVWYSWSLVSLSALDWHRRSRAIRNSSSRSSPAFRGRRYRGERLVELAKKYSSKAFIACNDPLEAAVFSVLVETIQRQDLIELQLRKMGIVDSAYSIGGVDLWTKNGLRSPLLLYPGRCKTEDHRRYDHFLYPMLKMSEISPIRAPIFSRFLLAFWKTS